MVGNPREPIPVEDHDDLNFLKNYQYDQSRPIKKKDIIFYYDVELQEFIRVSVISRSYFRDYYNIKFIDQDRPKCGIYFRKGDFWSFTRPAPVHEVQQPASPPLPIPPSPEVERRSMYSRDSR